MRRPESRRLEEGEERGGRQRGCRKNVSMLALRRRKVKEERVRKSFGLWGEDVSVRGQFVHAEHKMIFLGETTHKRRNRVEKRSI